MSFNIDWEMAEMFHEAVMQDEAQQLRTSEDWQKADELITRGKAERKKMQETYELEYDTRHEMKRKQIIDDAGRKKFDHPTPFGRDKFDSEAIDRQAHREVQHDHLNDLQISRDNEKQEMENLQETARKRDEKEGILKDDFEKSKDRRQQGDRRGPTRSR